MEVQPIRGLIHLPWLSKAILQAGFELSAVAARPCWAAVLAGVKIVTVRLVPWSPAPEVTATSGRSCEANPRDWTDTS